MQYKNSVTGAVVETNCNISGGDWVPIEEKAAHKTKKQKKRGESR